MKYLEERPVGEETTEVISWVMGGMVEEDPINAFEWAGKVDVKDDVRERAIKGVLQTWAESDPEAALAWSEARNDELQGRAYSKVIIRHLAIEYPEESFALALKTVQVSKNR